MKRFATALVLCGALAVAGGAFAEDFVWDGTPSDIWEDGRNWSIASAINFPGSDNPSGQLDRALINNIAGGGNQIVKFTNSSGDATYAHRVVMGIRVDSDTNELDMTLQVNASTDSLDVAAGPLELRGGTTEGNIAMLDMDGGRLTVPYLLLDGSQNTSSTPEVLVDLAADTQIVVAQKTEIRGHVNFVLASGSTFDMNYLTINDGKFE